MSIVILYQTEGEEQKEVLLTGKIVIGRSSKSDLVISDTKISGRHCSLEVTKDGKVMFKDLESTNGSYVAHTKVVTHMIRLTEEVQIGNTTLKIDEKRLSPMERLNIGKPNVSPSKNGEMTLPTLTKNTDKPKQTMSIVKSKQKPNREVNVTGKDRLIEQEESSGNTGMLKIDSGAVKKKK